jgi:hypothetical protein
MELGEGPRQIGFFLKKKLSQLKIIFPKKKRKLELGKVVQMA